MVADIVSFETVPITDSKEMQSQIAVEIRLNYVHVLVRLFGVVHAMTHTGGKGKLSDAVEP